MSILDNYKLSRGINNANPGVMACRLWQESQGLPDEVSKAIVGLLKLQGIPTNVTYKILFENYLSNHLSTLMKRYSGSQNKLAMLVERMISMFQVTQIQPLIVNILDLLIDIPESAMSKILDDTSSSHNFYKICTPNIKRKIWVASPEKFYETVINLIFKALFLLRLGIIDEEMKKSTGYENRNEYNMIIAQILQLIGDPQNECSRILYCQVVKMLKLLFIRSSVQYKTNLNRPGKTQNSGRSENTDILNLVNISKIVECNLCFKTEQFSRMKNENLDFKYNKISSEDLCNLYIKYTDKTMGLYYSCAPTDSESVSTSQSPEESTKAKKYKQDNQQLSVNIDEDIVYLDRGEAFFSTIRYSIAIKCQEMYKITNADMKLIEPNFNLLQLINKVHNSVENNLPTNELMNIINKKNMQNSINIKDDMDLFNVSFILCNPILYDKIISYYVYHLFNMDLILLTSNLDISYWLSLITLGLSCTYISIVKFILDSERQDKEDKQDSTMGQKHVSYFKSYVNMCKPVSLKKVLSYIYPMDKRTSLATSQLPPFFANFISPTLISHESEKGGAFKRLSEFDVEGELYKIPVDDPDMTFHSLLILYLPKLDTHLLSNFKNACRNFVNLFQNTTEDNGQEERGGVAPISASEVDFSSEETARVISKMLLPFEHSKFSSNTHIDHLMSILQRQFSTVKKSKPSTIGQLNFTLLYIMMKKLSGLSPTTMNILSSTSNITKLLFKMITLEMVKTCIKNKSSHLEQNYDNLLKFISSKMFNKETVVNFKSPTDYLYLRLLRTIMFSNSDKSTKEVVFKFVENVSNYSVATSFILLFYFKKYGSDKNTSQTLERLSRNCHRILYDKENKNNLSYQYRKWISLFDEVKQALE
ncbi:hypothetical protein MACK_000702 [Theileria orientalis]|uniref:Uncharacterized protein n=1 Tax=Theileria orientalis TaxID=68886 RepID=A0A976M9X7_THEOR|nr:hypothetical protein MACK_000702 [Theileria orientalis]